MTDYKKIVFLASYPKSGNTWVRCFFDAYFLGEIDINDIVVSVSDDTSTRYAIGDGSDIRTMPIDIQQLARPMSLLRLVREYNHSGVDAVPLIVKTHCAHMVSNGIELLPHALTQAVIHIVRDPRDVFLSFEKHMGLDRRKSFKAFFDKYRVISDDNAAKVADLISSWPANVGSYSNCGTHNIKTFRYEDMKAHPVEAFSQILEHAGVEPDRARVEEALEMVTLDRLRKQEDEKGFKEASPNNADRFFGKGESGGWRGRLSPFEENAIIKACRSMMKRYGYIGKAGRKAA